MNVGISRVGQIAITARDIDRATAFYGDKLGLRLLFTAGKLACTHERGASRSIALAKFSKL